ncbi:MAG: L-threonylcarbamoyladenylate synthase [Fluviicola sp.]|nr:L-threonylcarbamoyladenylate synthase [Fluviicola sp.]
MFIEINPSNMDQRLITQIVESLRKGELIIFPTDTVYAVGCDVTNKKALAALAKWKGVKVQKANFSIICSDISQLSEYVKQVDRGIFRLLKQSLPGPFTFILQATNEVSKLFDSSKKEIGIRIPDNKITLAIVEVLGNPMATTSLHDEEDEIADYFVDPSVIYERFDDEFAFIIDGGLGHLEASTIVDCTSGTAEIVRQGIGHIDL